MLCWCPQSDIKITAFPFPLQIPPHFSLRILFLPTPSVFFSFRGAPQRPLFCGLHPSSCVNFSRPPVFSRSQIYFPIIPPGYSGRFFSLLGE